jgi:hypothetical protein
MRKKRRTDIMVETDQVLVIRQQRSLTQTWCQGCAEQVKMVTVEQAAAVAGVSLRAIFRRVEAGKLHFTETPDGLLFICLNSLLK